MPRVDQMAARLHMSARTLHRRLAEGGTSYQAILDGIRERLAIEFLERTDLSVALIEALDLTRHFAFIAGPDAVSARKPSGAHIHEAVQKAGGDPVRCVMVGDSTTDTKAAKDAGVGCIVVGFGYNDVPREELGGDVGRDRGRGDRDAGDELGGT